MSSKWKHSLHQPSQHSLTLQRCSSRKKPASLWPWGLCCWPPFSLQDRLPVWLFRSLVLTMPSAEHCGELRLPICVRLCLFCIWICMFVLFFSRNVQFTVISNESLRDLTPKCRSSFCFNVNLPKLWYFSRLFAAPCAEISTKLIKQIQDFNPLTGCGECHYMVRSTSVNVNDVFFHGWNKIRTQYQCTREIYFRVMTRCFLFQVVSATAQSIKANHTSPDGLQCENITFSLSPTVLTGGCRVSVSICDANSLTVASIIQSHTAVSCFNKTVLIALWQKAQSFAQ